MTMFHAIYSLIWNRQVHEFRTQTPHMCKYSPILLVYNIQNESPQCTLFLEYDFHNWVIPLCFH